MYFGLLRSTDGQVALKKVGNRYWKDAIGFWVDAPSARDLFWQRHRRMLQISGEPHQNAHWVNT
jgi:hypothetical protein